MKTLFKTDLSLKPAAASRSLQVSPRSSPALNKPAMKISSQGTQVQSKYPINGKNLVSEMKKVTSSQHRTPREMPSLANSRKIKNDESSLSSNAEISTVSFKSGLQVKSSRQKGIQCIESAVPVRKIEVSLAKNSEDFGPSNFGKNKIQSDGNFSASIKNTMKNQVLSPHPGNHQATYSQSQQSMRGINNQNPYQMSIKGSTAQGSSFAQTIREGPSILQNNTLTKDPIETSLSGYLESVGDEGESDISCVITHQVVPCSIKKFSNVFGYEPQIQMKPFKEMNTLDRILEEADKVQHQLTSNRMSDTLNICSTQACTYSMKPQAQNLSKDSQVNVGPSKRIFHKCQLSPSRIRDTVDLAKLPHKVLPTVEPGEITRSDISISHHFSICSNIVIGANDCSVPDIVTDSSLSSEQRILRNSHFRQNGSILSQGAPLFPHDHRDPDCIGHKITHNSCLQASCGQDSCSSSKQSSLIEGISKCSCCKMNDDLSNTLKSQLQSKFMLNLETVLIQETKLWSIVQLMAGYSTEYQNTSFYGDIISQCEEWWQMTKDQACLFELYKIYRDTQTRKSIRKATILEAIVMVITVFEGQLQRDHKQKSSKRVLKKLSKIFSLLHQNMLHVICLILQRMGLENCDSNAWAVTLRESVIQKIAYIEGIQRGTLEILLLDEPQRNLIMSKNSCLVIQGIKSLHKALSNSQTTESALFTHVSSLLKEIEKTHIIRVKDILVQGLTQDVQSLQRQEKSQLYQNQSSWQEYPLDDLECDESLHLPSSPLHAPNCPNTDVQNVHLSTINEDCSYCSQNQSNPDGSNPAEQVPLQPFLPPLIGLSKKYTLVLDLDETLIHYVEPSFEESSLTNQYLHTDQQNNNHDEDENGGQFLVRPGVHKFLREMAQHYEIVIFTAAMQDYADWVLDQLDVENCISYRLYRQHAIQTDQVFIKDLSRIGRDLSRTLIVDNVAENFQLQPDNGVFIRTWIDDPNDNALDELAPLLKEIVVKKIDDVRDALRTFRLQMMEQVQRGIMKPQLSLDYAYPPETPGKRENPEEVEGLRQIDQNRTKKEVNGGRKY